MSSRINLTKTKTSAQIFQCESDSYIYILFIGFQVRARSRAPTSTPDYSCVTLSSLVSQQSWPYVMIFLSFSICFSPILRPSCSEHMNSIKDVICSWGPVVTSDSDHHPKLDWKTYWNSAFVYTIAPVDTSKYIYHIGSHLLWPKLSRSQESHKLDCPVQISNGLSSHKQTGLNGWMQNDSSDSCCFNVCVCH